MVRRLRQNQPLLLFIIIAGFWFSQYVYIPYQAPFLNAQGVSSHIIGIALGIYGGAQLVLRVPVGVAADYGIKHKKIILLGIAAAGLGSFVRYLIPTELGYLLGNLFSGAASASWLSFMIFFLSLFEESRQKEQTSRANNANNVGRFLAFTFSALLYGTFHMKSLLLLSISVSMLTFLFALLLDESHLEISYPKNSIKELLKVGFNKQLLYFTGLAFVQQGIQITTTMAFTNQILEDLSTSPSWAVGVSAIIFMLSAVMFSHLGAQGLISKLKQQTWIIIGFVLLTLYCLLVPLMPHFLWIYALQVIPGFAVGLLFSLLNAEAMAQVPSHQRSTALGYFQAIYAGGMTLFPIIAGYLVDYYSMTAAFGFLAVTCLIAIASVPIAQKINPNLFST